MLHGDVLGERTRLTPDKTALVIAQSGRRLTYRELDQRAVDCARIWRELLGLAAGDRCAILAGNRLEYVDCFFAAGKSGVVLVPLGTRLTPAELAYIVRDSGARALIYDAEHAEAVRVLRSEHKIELEHWVTLDEQIDLPDLRYETLRSQLSGAGQPLERCDPEQTYCLVYTSGTTGRPKGVMAPHRMIAWNGFNTVVCWQLREDDVSPIFTPLYHAGAQGAFLVPLFTVGGTVVLHREFDVAEVLQTIERERCTVVLGVPTIYKMLLESPLIHETDLSHVRWLISGGAPLPEYLVAAYQELGVVLRQGYGLTEVGVNCFAMTSEDAWRKKGSIGKPLICTEARLSDERGAEVPAGEVGELLFRGPHVSKGYWNNPEATREAYDEQGWFHTGDLARCDEEGFFYIAGRKKEMFISGGVNVYPAEIEGELLQHAGVQDAAVVGVEDPKWGEVGVSFVVPRPEQALSADELASFLGQRLAKYKIPRDFVFVDDLPRTPYGKVVKGELRDSYRIDG